MRAERSVDELRELLKQRVAELENKALSKNQSEPEQSQLNPTQTANIQAFLKNVGLPGDFEPLATKYFELAPRLRLVWLHLAECTGCSESFFRAETPNLDECLLDFFSVEYHETLMTSSGWHTEEQVLETINGSEPFVLAVEGGVAPIDTYFYTIGAHSKNGYQVLNECAANASAVFAIGSCSSWGGIQAATPNPSKCCGIADVLSCEVVLVPGCPPSSVNIIANLLFYALFGCVPNLDEQNRPKWAYSKCLHDMCERKVKFESGLFAESFDDELAKSGACLFKIGCKGPYTYNNCPKVKFNAKTSWPVQAGHGCMACSEADFWDDYGFYELPMANAYAYRDFSFANFIKCGVTNACDGGVNLDVKGENACESCYSGVSSSTKANKSTLVANTCAFKDDKNALFASAVWANACKITLGENYDSKNALLCLDEKPSLLYNDDENGLCDFLTYECEANARVILQNLSKNKIGASLVQVYAQHFGENYAFLQENFDETPAQSVNLRDFFGYIYALYFGRKMQDLNEFFDAAVAYKFKHASPFDIKLSASESSAKLDVSKAYRMPLIYMCGGMDFEGIAFSASKAVFAQLKTALSTLKNQGKSVNLRAIKGLNQTNLDFIRANLG